MRRKRILIAGAAGRDFHNFNVVYRDRREDEVVAFTATQIPNIDGRVYPPLLAGEPHLAEGNLVFAGIDYAAIIEAAEQEADVIVWDGGNNDTPFVRPNLHIVVVDPHRPGHELRYHPGETNLRLAHVCVVNKVDSADQEGIDAVLDSIRTHNPEAQIVL